ncbi:MAG: hypothetical protein ACFFEW_02440 [Candidatus Thorarchaeota archaeon]
MTYSNKELKKYLKSLLKEKNDLSTFSFEYLSGHTAYHTRLKIIVTSERIVHRRIRSGVPVGGPEEEKEAVVQELEFSAEKLVAFVKELIEKKIWDLENCTTRALPNMALFTFSIRKNDEIVFKQEVWEICRNDDDKTRELIRVLSALIPEELTPP